MFTVGDLISMLQDFDENMPVKIGMRQRYGTDFANDIDGVEEHKIRAFYGDNYKAIVIEQGGQTGAVKWDDYDEEEYEEDE